jgi:hypothetical protein
MVIPHLIRAGSGLRVAMTERAGAGLFGRWMEFRPWFDKLTTNGIFDRLTTNGTWESCRFHHFRLPSHADAGIVCIPPNPLLRA